MDTKYNLSITTSGENGDHASTNISTGDPGKLASILQLAGMSSGHPVPMDAQVAPEVAPDEEHGSCDVCGGMHEGDDHVEEGESYDNEPNEFIHDPEEVTHTGNDLHKIKKTYPKVAGGDNPMALEEELRAKYENFLTETEQVEEHANTLVSPWKKTVTEQSEAQKAAFEKMLAAKNGDTVEEEDEADSDKEEVEENFDTEDLRKLAGI